jgi:tetratricopeptide (TPR) repeat protein
MSLPLFSSIAHQDNDATIVFQKLSDFSPAEIRTAIADLVKDGEPLLANALADAGLSLYPDSEDILAIAALLAETQADWQTAESLLERLSQLQGNSCTPHVFRHLIRVQRCLCEIEKALMTARRALSLYPDDQELNSEYDCLKTDFEAATLVTSTASVQ